MSKKKTNIEQQIDKSRVEAAIVLQQYHPKIFPKLNAYDRNKTKEETMNMIEEVGDE